MKQHLQTLHNDSGNQDTDTFFARFDHRTLLIVWAVFIIALVSTGKYDLFRTLSFIAFPVFTIITMNIPIGYLIKRLLILSPFVIIMAAANPFLDRTPLTTLGRIPVTTGMLSASVIIVKALIALSMMLILDRCISINGLCHALRRFGVPSVFTTQLLLMHRYAFLIFSEATTMLKARDLRASGKRGKGPIDTANLIGSLLLRSAERSERVYKAMLARGFSGTLPISSTGSFGSRDIVFITLSLGCFMVLRFIL